MKKTVCDVITYVAVFLAIQVVVTVIVGVLCKVFTGWSAPASWQIIVSDVVSNILALIIFLRARWTVVSRHYLQTGPWFALFWCACAASGALAPSLWLQELMPDLPNVAEESFDLILQNKYGYFAVGLLAPVVEELVFRGAVLRSLLNRCRHHWTAIAVSAVVFSLIHFNPAQMPHAFLCGLLLGWMYYRTGSIVPGITFHWVNNTIACVLYQLVPDPDATLTTLLGGSERHVMLALIFSLCIFLPSLYQLNLRLKK